LFIDDSCRYFHTIASFVWHSLGPRQILHYLTLAKVLAFYSISSFPCMISESTKVLRLVHDVNQALFERLEVRKLWIKCYKDIWLTPLSKFRLNLWHEVPQFCHEGSSLHVCSGVKLVDVNIHMNNHIPKAVPQPTTTHQSC